MRAKNLKHNGNEIYLVKPLVLKGPDYEKKKTVSPFIYGKQMADAIRNKRKAYIVDCYQEFTNYGDGDFFDKQLIRFFQADGKRWYCIDLIYCRNEEDVWVRLNYIDNAKYPDDSNWILLEFLEKCPEFLIGCSIEKLYDDRCEPYYPESTLFRELRGVYDKEKILDYFDRRYSMRH